MVKIDKLVDISNEKHYVSNGYVYFVKKFTRNKAKKHTDDDRICVGKLADDKTKMYPNLKYFELKKEEEKSFEIPGKIDSYLHVGPYFAFLKISQNYSIYDTLEKVFGADSNKIFALSLFSIVEENLVSQHYDRYAFSNYTGLSSSMSTGNISELYKKITSKKIENFLEEYQKSYKKQEPIDERRLVAFDSTNQNTSSFDMLFAEKGHSKKESEDPQINTAIFVDETTKIPLYYETFYGSLLDKTQAGNTLRNAEDLGFKKIFFMMDRGYYSTENLKILSEKEFGLMCPENLDFVKKAFNDYQYIKNKRICYIESENVYGTKFEISFGKDKYFGYIYYDQARAPKEIDSINFKLKILRKKIEENRFYSKKLAEKYEKYFTILKTDFNKNKSKFKILENETVIQELMDKAGMFVIISNVDMTVQKMIEIARARDTSEKVFKRIKDTFDFDCPRVYTDEAFTGKMFVAFLSCLLVETYRYKIRKYLDDLSNRTTHTSITSLNKIVAYKNNQDKWILKYALTKENKEILSLIGYTEKALIDSISSIAL